MYIVEWDGKCIVDDYLGCYFKLEKKLILKYVFEGFDSLWDD